MEQYIPKSALVAEIEKLQKLYCYGKSDGMLIAKSVFDSIKNIINTLEVKEMDLEKEYKEYVEEDPVYNKLVNGVVGKAIAKHFFELGLKAQIMTSKLQQRISVLKMSFWTGLQTFEETEMTLSDAYNQGVDDILEELGLKAQKGDNE